MNRWNLLLLTLCLLAAPAVSADGHEPNGHAYGHGGHHDHPKGGGNESQTVDEEQMGDAEVKGGSSSSEAFALQDRCILYEWAGGVEDARVEITPILGILVLSPMDCVEEIIEVDDLAEHVPGA